MYKTGNNNGRIVLLLSVRIFEDLILRRLYVRENNYQVLQPITHQDERGPEIWVGIGLGWVCYVGRGICNVKRFAILFLLHCYWLPRMFARN